VVNTYPTLSQEGSVNQWVESLQDDTVLTASRLTGKEFKGANRVFDPISFQFNIPRLLDTDKVTLLAFYIANREKEFYWTHPGTLTIHTVSFDGPPEFVALGEANLWSATQDFTTTS